VLEIVTAHPIAGTRNSCAIASSLAIGMVRAVKKTKKDYDRDNP
jgi:hypothetical protein